MCEKELFELGIKPALLVKYKVRDKNGSFGDFTSIFKEFSNKYPYILFDHRNGVLFFHDFSHKEWFEENGCVSGYSERFGKWVRDYKFDVLGLVLGYPPSAVKSWVEKLRFKRESGDRVHIDYYGIRFVCEPYDVVNCINWLLINRPVPDHVKRKCGIYVGRVKYESAYVL